MKRLYYDTVSFSPYTLKMVRDMVGADHMVMGAIIHTAGIDRQGGHFIEGPEIDQEEISRIFSGTALSILNNICNRHKGGKPRGF